MLYLGQVDLGRVAGVAVLAWGTAALTVCYAQPAPPAATVVTPNEALPPAPPPAPPPATPQFGSTAPAAEAPSSAGTATVIVAPIAPPAPLTETPGPAPTALAIWQVGHWSWDGTTFNWTPGHYVMRPSPSANWVPGYWQPGPGGWTWINGYWS